MSHIKAISILSAIQEQFEKKKDKKEPVKEIKNTEKDRTYIGGDILRFGGFELW